MFILDAVSKSGCVVYCGRMRGICLEEPRRTKRRSLSGLPMFRHICYTDDHDNDDDNNNNNNNNNVINLTYANVT